VAISPPEIVFYNAADGRRLAARVWRPAGPRVATVVLLHGITSHGGWYARGCAHLAAAGCEVHFLDRRGSGLNSKGPADIDCWQTWIDDVATYLQPLVERAANESSLPNEMGLAARPVLAGISWGGKLATAVARQHPGLLSGLALVCPGLYSHFDPRCCARLALAAPMPERVQRKSVRIPLRDPELFIGNPDWRRFVETDPLALRRITWRFAREDRKLTRFARNAATYLHLPMLLMLAGRDRIVHNRRTRTFFGRFASEHKKLQEYRDATHTLEFETEPTRYFNDFLDWVEQATSKIGKSARG
jgi:acylglycerol lipase